MGNQVSETFPAEGLDVKKCRAEHLATLLLWVLLCGSGAGVESKNRGNLLGCRRERVASLNSL